MELEFSNKNFFFNNYIVDIFLKILNILLKHSNWQKRESPPVGFEPNASHLPDEHPTARPQRTPILPITHPSDLLCSH